MSPGLSLALGPSLGALAALAGVALGLGGGAPVVLGVTAWVAWWWMAEPVDNAFSSLVPFAVFPLAGVLDGRALAGAYGNALILLLAGGFMLSAALEHSGVHRRLALGLVRALGGGSAGRLVVAFGVATAVLSMWVSNTASTLMMLPVARAVVDAYPDRRLDVPLVLAVAYAASIGGLGTPIGTPPNLIFMSVYEDVTGERMSFIGWMIWAAPVVAALLGLTLAWLARGLWSCPPASLPPAPPWTAAERRVLGIFGAVALGWVTRTEPFGGWSAWIGAPTANDAAVALCGVVAMASLGNGRGERLLPWEVARGIPWGTLLLFGGGLAIAEAFEVTGLSDVIAGGLGRLQALPLGVLLVVLCAGVTALSEIASNTAAAVLLMPILGAAAKGMGVDPALLMLPGALAASCGFMLPVATGPNAIAHGSGLVHARDMMRHGAVVDALGVVVIAGVCWLWFGLA